MNWISSKVFQKFVPMFRSFLRAWTTIFSLAFSMSLFRQIKWMQFQKWWPFLALEQAWSHFTLNIMNFWTNLPPLDSFQGVFFFTSFLKLREKFKLKFTAEHDILGFPQMEFDGRVYNTDETWATTMHKSIFNIIQEWCQKHTLKRDSFKIWI